MNFIWLALGTNIPSISFLWHSRLVHFASADSSYYLFILFFSRQFQMNVLQPFRFAAPTRLERSFFVFSFFDFHLFYISALPSSSTETKGIEEIVVQHEFPLFCWNVRQIIDLAIFVRVSLPLLSLRCRSSAAATGKGNSTPKKVKNRRTNKRKALKKEE